MNEDQEEGILEHANPNISKENWIKVYIDWVKHRRGHRSLTGKHLPKHSHVPPNDKTLEWNENL